MSSDGCLNFEMIAPRLLKLALFRCVTALCGGLVRFGRTAWTSGWKVLLSTSFHNLSTASEPFKSIYRPPMSFVHFLCKSTKTRHCPFTNFTRTLASSSTAAIPMAQPRPASAIHLKAEVQSSKSEILPRAHANELPRLEWWVMTTVHPWRCRRTSFNIPTVPEIQSLDPVYIVLNSSTTQLNSQVRR